MNYRLCLLAALGLLAPACGETNGTSDNSGGTGGAGTGAEGGGGNGPIADPAAFDCTAPKAPERVNAIPIACATDRKCTTTLVSGHRACGGDLGMVAPENTLSAVRAAILLGLDFVETDPRPTKDGFLVNLHGTSVDDTTDGTGLVEELTLAEIQELKIDAERFTGDFSCDRVPTLEQVLTLAKGKVHVLVDANKTDRVDLLVAAIQSTGTLEWAIFDTDSVEKLDEALALEPNLLTMLRVSTIEELEMELAHFAAHPPVIIEINDGASPLKLVPPIKEAQHRAHGNVFVQDIAAAIDDKADAYDQTIANGIVILQSDRPDLVLRALDRWPPPAQP